MAHVVIVGAGFAGCTAIRSLRKGGFDGEITLVAPKAELFYFPSLIWVPAGRRSEADLRVPLADFLNKHDVKHIAASATGLDESGKTLLTDGDAISWDYLIIASGGRYIRKLPGIENAHIVCAGWEPTKAFSDRLAELEGGNLVFGFGGNPKEPSAMRGGPVFEFMFGVDTLLKQQGRRKQFKLHFVSPAPRPGARMGDKAVDRLLGEMKRREITTHLGAKLTGMTATSVSTENDEVASDLTLFIPGMTGPAWAANSGLQLSDGGFFKADPQARVQGSECVYVAGDAGSFPGPEWKPKQAHMADLQAEAAANNIIAAIAGRPQTHSFKTELICIVDTLNSASLVYRDPKRAFMLGLPPLHWMKVLFEWWYLRAYR